MRAALEGTGFVAAAGARHVFPARRLQRVFDAPDVAFAERLLTEAGVATIPLSPFYKDPPRLTVLRLCVAKKDQTLDDAVARLQAFANGILRRMTMVEPTKLRVTLVQQPLVWQDAAANREHFDALLAPLAGNTDLVVLPEMFTTGFSMDVERLAEEAGGPTSEWLERKARELNAAVTGSVMSKDGSRFYNRMFWARARRAAASLRQAPSVSHGERASELHAGRQRRCVVEWRGFRICPLVCYDLRFPVFSRRRAELDYDVLIYVGQLARATPPRVAHAAEGARDREPCVRHRRESRRHGWQGSAVRRRQRRARFSRRAAGGAGERACGRHRGAGPRGVACIPRAISRPPGCGSVYARLMKKTTARQSSARVSSWRRTTIRSSRPSTRPSSSSSIRSMRR